jgi:hypothetical protein
MKLKTILGVAIAAGTLVSCSVDDADNAQVSAQESYTRNFIKTFGTISPNQDWNMVEQKSITVNTGSPTDVLIYEKQGNEYRLAANYTAVSGTKTITFDGVENDDTPFIVSLDGNMMLAKNGETVNYKRQNGSKRLRSSAMNCNWIVRNGNAVTINLHPDDRVNYDLIEQGEGVDNYKCGIVTRCAANPFMLTLPQGSIFTVYPMHHGYNHGTKNNYEVGIFYYDAESGQTIKAPFYKTEDGNEDFTEVSGRKGNYGGTFTTHGYDIKPEKGIQAGFYVKVGDKYYYSDASKSPDGAACFAYRFVGTGNDTKTYICFDDPTGGQDNDFNDFILYFEMESTPVSPKSVSWLVACEDLSNTFDYDFNDVIFRVYHVSGNDFLTVEPVAAGGTLETYLYYGDTQVSEEWHKHFGDGYDTSKMINTGQITEKNVWRITLKNIPTDFSMKSFSTDASSFKIYVPSRNFSVVGPQAGKAPQMLILPYNWNWPKELTSISKTYPLFGEWGTNYTNSGWVNYKTEGNYVNMTADDLITTKANKEVTIQQL